MRCVVEYVKNTRVLVNITVCVCVSQPTMIEVEFVELHASHQLSTSLGLKTSHVLSTQLPAGKYKDVDNTVTSSVRKLIGCQLDAIRK